MSSGFYSSAVASIPVVRERTVEYGAPRREYRNLDRNVDAALLSAISANVRAQARIMSGQAALIARIKETKAHEKLGFHFGDLARELLMIDPRTARNRISLHRTLTARPLVRKAFLRGDVSSCQVLVFAGVLTDENERFWLDLCRVATVEELVIKIREERRARDAAVNEGHVASASAGATTTITQTGNDPDDPVADHADVRFVSLEAPPVVRLAWNDGLRLARRVLGYEAPVYRCVEAILAEAAPGECPEEPLPRTSRRKRGSAMTGEEGPHDRHDAPIATATAIRKAGETIVQLDDLLADIDDLLDASEEGKPRELIDRVRVSQIVERPLRVLLGRLLRHLRSTGALYRLGYLKLEEFTEEHLHLSARATRDLCRESEVFADCPRLEDAFASGRVGIRQALLIDRFAPRQEADAFIRRAGEVTFRQFAREMRLVELFAELGLGRFMKPLPLRGLVGSLVRELISRGWPAEYLAEELASHGFDEHARWIRSDRSEPCPYDATDPAETTLTPIEILVDLLLLASFDPDDPRANDVRQTFSVAEERESPVRRPGRIAFLAPEPIVRHWQAAIRSIGRRNSLLPAWACVMILLSRAVETWTCIDPDTLPANRKVFERDDYLCVVPGCSRRSQLEAHHIEFLSRGGSDRRSNLVSMCHGHHAHMLHRGAIRLRGSAPHALEWEIGCTPGLPPIWRLRGEKITS